MMRLDIGKKLDKSFYLQDTLTAARSLIGKYIVADGEIAMRITETEAYIGSIDKACHCYGGRMTPRTEVMFREGGCAYIYLIYGMYCCFNVVTEQRGNGCAVLIRGAEPVFGLDRLSLNRYGVPYSQLDRYKLKNFGNGPGKLCKAMGIDKSLNGIDLTGDRLCITYGESGENICSEIKAGKRINIDYAEEARDFMWRFYV